MGNEDNLGDEKQTGFETERELALQDLTPWLETLSEEELDTPYLAIGPRTFSPREVVQEIETGSADGRELVEMLTDHRLELAAEEGFEERE